MEVIFPPCWMISEPCNMSPWFMKMKILQGWYYLEQFLWLSSFVPVENYFRTEDIETWIVTNVSIVILYGIYTVWGKLSL